MYFVVIVPLTATLAVSWQNTHLELIKGGALLQEESQQLLGIADIAPPVSPNASENG